MEQVKVKAKDPNAVTLTNKRTAKLSARRRREIARGAVTARWARQKAKEQGPEEAR